MSEEGESSDVTNTSEIDEKTSLSESEMESHEKTSSHKAKGKARKRSKYSSLKSRFKKLEALVTKAFSSATISSAENATSTGTNPGTSGKVKSKASKTNSGAQDLEVVYRRTDDTLSIHADDDEFASSDEGSTDSKDKLSEQTKKCLFDMFGEDAMVQKRQQSDGIVLDRAQVEVLESSFRCKDPNFLTAFSEENVEAFPVDSEFEKFLKVPSLDDLVDGCLSKRYGHKASFVKNKGKSLFTQPCKMVDKIGFKGQHAARMGIIMQCYVQQSLGNLLQFLDSEDFDKEAARTQVKDVFAMSTKVLDQLGRTGALHHINRRTVAMTDTGLYEQHDNWEFSNLPLSGEGVFGPDLEPLLKARKEKRKQVEDLIPDVQKPKRKFSGAQTESSKRPAFDRQVDRPATNTWNNFRIPRVSYRGARGESRGWPRGRGSYGSFPRRQAAGGGRGRLERPAEK